MYRVSRSPTVSAPSIPAADRTELLQARSRWEQLVEEAESNEQLTPEQRQSFVEEGRKRIAEISKQLEELG
jgi:Spy/CpxP family protein refolding chaperone